MRLQLFAALFFLTHSALASNNFYGIDISSFNANGQCRSDGPCAGRPTRIVTKADPFYSSGEWDSIVANAKKNGYKRFRTYGNDCGTCDFVSVGNSDKHDSQALPLTAPPLPPKNTGCPSSLVSGLVSSPSSNLGVVFSDAKN